MATGARGIRCLILFRRDHLPPMSDHPKTDVLQLFSGTSSPSSHIRSRPVASAPALPRSPQVDGS